LSHSYRARGTVWSGLLFCLLVLAWLTPVKAAPKKARSAPIDVMHDFGALAQQRPWACADQQGGGAPQLGWEGGTAQCVWQNRLRMRRWSGPGEMSPGACVSAPAHWWTWARGRALPAGGQSPAWREAWPSQSLEDQHGLERRIVVIERQADGRWTTTEWRWQPSARAATRRWQEGRWKLLAERARQLRQAGETYRTPDARSLGAALERNLGRRPAQASGERLTWETDGLCLHADVGNTGQRVLNLPYALDESRMEQRAAMQLQLARRYPKATWLTPFSLIPAPPNVRSGAKFYALWLEDAVVKGQIWIPTKSAGPLLRVRISTRLPAMQAGSPDPKLLFRVQQVVQRELGALASRWTYEHE